ncbi:MAG: hypothetical protein DDG59_01390 [Anaerolineae bacterium]|jgi:ABC-type multidrug transport system fused ATPase/permease subunit|nr:MAG: hypothetical protein DDG59_01390 [Anaerolineae bacterium]
MTGEKKQPARPRSVIILAVIQALQGVGLLGAGLYQGRAAGWDLWTRFGEWQYIPLPLFESLSNVFVLVVLGLAMILVSIALLRLASWAWLFSMTLQGMGLFIGLVNYLRHRPNYLGMVMGIFLVFYLNLDEVQAALRRKKEKG